MNNISDHGGASAPLSLLRTVKWRRWVTFLKNHYLSGDAPYWENNHSSWPIGDYRNALRFASGALDNDEVRRHTEKAARHFGNLDKSTSFLFRLCWLIWVLPLLGWSLYIALALNDWGQFISQLVVWSLNTSLAIARLRNKRTTGWIIFKFYEDRVLGDLPAIVFYTIVSRPEYRYLYQDEKSKWIVGCLTGLWLLLISFWDELWFEARFWWWKSQISRGSISLQAIAAYKDFVDLQKKFQDHTKDVDVSDVMNQHLLMARQAGSRASRMMACLVPAEDVLSAPRYGQWQKVPLLVIAAGIQAQACVASYNSNLFFAITLGWAIWIAARMSSCVLRGVVSGQDASITFSNIAVGAIILLPLTLSMLLMLISTEK